MLRRELLDKTFDLRSVAFDDPKEVQQKLERLQERMRDTAKRIPVCVDAETYQNNNEFNTWAILALWAMGDQYWWHMHSSILKRANSPAWGDVLPRQVTDMQSSLMLANLHLVLLVTAGHLFSSISVWWHVANFRDGSGHGLATTNRSILSFCCSKRSSVTLTGPIPTVCVPSSIRLCLYVVLMEA